jgi:hypothetical protein
MGHQAIQYNWCSKRSPMSKAAVQDSQPQYTMIGNLTVLSLLFLPEMLMAYFLWFTNFPHRINLYYSGMIIVPVLFIIASGSCSAYVSLVHNMFHRCAWRTVAVTVGVLVAGFTIQNCVTFSIAHHAEWSVRRTIWQDMGNIVFLCVNPAMETFFWRVFMHRELALRWFPSKTQCDEQLLPLNAGAPVQPRLSTFGTMLCAGAFSLYHYVPFVMYDLPVYAKLGMTYHMALSFMVWLVIFGYMALYVREKLGILAAWALHLGVDLSDICMYTYIMVKLTGHAFDNRFKSWE